MILAILICKSPRYFLPRLESNGLSVQEKKRKIDFQDGGHLGFPIGTYQSFKRIGILVQKEKQKITFQNCCHGSHLGFRIAMILAIFNLQVTQILSTKFGVKWPFGSGEEAKNRYSRWRPSWISDRNILTILIFTINVKKIVLGNKQQTHYRLENGSLGFIIIAHL